MTVGRGEASEEFHCALVLLESFFLSPECDRMRFSSAARKARGVLDVQHFVVKDIGDYIFGDRFIVEIAIHYDLIERWIEAAELGAPPSLAPAQPRRRQRGAEIPAIQSVEQRFQIVVGARRAMLHSPGPPLAQHEEPAACRTGIRELTVRLNQLDGSAPPVKTAQQDRRDSLHYSPRCPSQNVGEPNVRGIVAQANGVGQISIGMIVDYEARWPARASKPSIHSLEKALAARNRRYF